VTLPTGVIDGFTDPVPRVRVDSETTGFDSSFITPARVEPCSQGPMFIEGEFIDTVSGIPGSRTEIVMFKAPRLPGTGPSAVTLLSRPGPSTREPDRVMT
jgi:hypothetical protein